MRTVIQIPFGEWLPDLPASDNPGVVDAKNVVPTATSFTALKSLQPFTDSLAGPCLGMSWVQDSSDNIHNFAGDNTKLYQLDTSSSWADVSQAGGYSARRWEFAKFGDRVIAVNGVNAPQKFDLGTDTTFSDLPNAPGGASTVAVVRDFVMFGDIDSLGSHFLQWSGYNNSENYTPSIVTQSDYQPLFGKGGRIQKIVPGSYATIFREQSIYIGEYTGPPQVFSFTEVDRKRGTPAPDSVVWSGETIWYFGWDGFYQMSRGRSESISNNRVSRWFEANSDSDSWVDMVGAIDRPRRLVMWAFKSSASSAYNDRLLIYNWASNRWAYAEVTTQFLAEYMPQGVTLDGLDAILTGGIDADSILVDSSAYTGGGLNLLAFDANGAAGTFDGDFLISEIEVGDVQSPDMMRLVASDVRPLVEGSGSTAVSVQLGHRNRLSDTVNYTNFKPIRRSGRTAFRKNARYLRARCRIENGFHYANGVKMTVNPVGGNR